MTKEKLTWTLSGNEGPADPHGVRRITVGDLGVVFQPIVDVSTGKTFAHEALVRCRRPEYASPPVLFEKAAEENACGRLGRLIREAAFSTCGDVALFVNLHPDELSSRWLVRPDDPLGFHTRPVFLEVTETAAFTHFELCQGVLKELCKRTGARLVVDDFGAGYSNLERVVDLEPAIVKLDLALTRDVHRHPRRQAVVRHVVNLCRELGASVVAEGVEVLDELKCVVDLGVTYAQGYLLARPATPPPPVVWPLGGGPPARPAVRAPRPVAPAAEKRPPPLPDAARRKPSRGSKAPAGPSSQKPTTRPVR